MAWSVARGAVAAVRYEPRYVDLVMACGTHQPEVPTTVRRWVVETRALPAVVKAAEVPHRMVTVAAREAARWFGPTGSVLVRWLSGATASAMNHASAAALERPLRARAHPGLLVPHPHQVAVLAVDMRGFSALTGVLDDTQYVADLVGEYLTELTAVVEEHRGVVFQYTGDGLLALFLPELSGATAATMLARLVDDMSPALHRRFEALRARWYDEWNRDGRTGSPVGLGAGISFGHASIGFLGPSGKKQFGVIGEPVNLAAYLCSEAPSGTLLVDRHSFTRADAPPPAGPFGRLRSKKPHQRIDVVRLDHGVDRSRRAWRR
jgi:class 3 adenylate cyclase